MKTAIENVETIKEIRFNYLKADAMRPKIYTLQAMKGEHPRPLISWKGEGENGEEITYYKGWCKERKAPRVLRSDRVVSYEAK